MSEKPENAIQPPAGVEVPPLEHMMEDSQYDYTRLLEYVCLHRFPVIQILDELVYFGETEIANFPGKLVERFQAKSGLTVYVYEHCIILGVGEMAYAEHSNYSRMIKTLFEFFRNHLPRYIQQFNWNHVAFMATHVHLEHVAWAIAKVLNLPVSELVDSPQARDIYLRISSHPIGNQWLTPQAKS